MELNVISLLIPKGQVAYLYDDYSLRQGMDRLRRGGYTALPVISRDGSYVGTVSEGDFLWTLVDREKNGTYDLEGQKVRNILRPDFNPAVRIDVELSELLDRAMRQSFIPVVDDRGAMVGIVTRQNIMRQLTRPNIQRPQYQLEAAGAYVN